jgi:hypothetical protein
LIFELLAYLSAGVEASLLLGLDHLPEYHHHTHRIVGYLALRRILIPGFSSSLASRLSFVGLPLSLHEVLLALAVIVDELLVTLESHVGEDIVTAKLLLRIRPDSEQGISDPHSD